MKKFFAIMAAACCTLALSATTYTCHIKVVVNGTVAEQEEVPVEVVNNNGVYDLSLNNFVLVQEGIPMPVGNIQVTGVEGVDQYGYTTIHYDAPLAITPGDDPQYDYWLGPMLGAVPVNMTARFTDSAANAEIAIDLEALNQVISVSIFGVAPVETALEGDVNKDQEVNVADVNTVIDIILAH